MTAALQEAPPMAAQHDDGERIARDEAARRLGVSLRTLDRYVELGYLDRERNPITRRTSYSAAEVEQLRRSREGA